MSVTSLHDALRNNDALEELFLSPAPVFDDKIIGALVELQKLRILRLGYIPQEGLVLDILGHLQKLEELKFKVGN